MLWERLYSGFGGSDIGIAVAVDDSRNAYVTGKSQDEVGYHGFATVKYDLSGNELWVKRYHGTGDGNHLSYDLALDGLGNTYVTGTSEGGSTGYDFATIKYVEFLCGDANADESVDLGDIVYLISYLYKNGPVPVPPRSGDVNRDGIVNLGDVVYLIGYLYKNGPPPCTN